MEHWGVIEWCALVTVVFTVGGSVGALVVMFFHGWRARERMFARLESVENAQKSDHRRVALLWDARDRGIPGLGTQTGLEGRGVPNPLLEEE